MEPSPATTLPPNRAIFDTLKGIGILEVMIHHALSHGARKFTDLHSPEWWALRITNRVLHFAIPLFLLVSAALLTQSLVKRPDWGRFIRRRAARTLWPYALWSLVYWGFRLAFLKIGSDVNVVERTYPLLGTLTGPHLLVDLPELLREFVWGKAYYHLYFMVVLLQLAIVLPWVMRALRGRALSLAAILAIAGVLQLGFFLLQSHWWRAAAPASLVVWYVPSVLVGVWIGLNGPHWRSQWERMRRPLLLLATVGLVLYLPMSLALERGWRVDSIAFNAAFGLFTIGTSLSLFGFAPSLSATGVGRWFARFGQVSLPMFLVHPMLLHFLSGPRITAVFDRLPFSVLWSIGALIALSYGFARLSCRIRLDRALFGQSLSQAAPSVSG